MTSLPYQYKDHLQSDRLITRFLKDEDAVQWSSFFQDKEATELFPAFLLKPGDDPAVHWISRQRDRYAGNRYGLQGLIEKTSGDLIGQCGLLLQEVDGIPELEVGYHIIKRYWGNGYAPEAARLFLDYALRVLQAPSVISIIDVRNVKSQRVAEKNGLKPEKQTQWNGLDVYIYRSTG